MGQVKVDSSSRYKVAIDEPMDNKHKEKKAKVFMPHDLRIGVDLSTLILGAITPVRAGLDLSLEYNLKPQLFLMLEGGYNNFKRENDRISYISQGQYVRLGLDYNIRKSTEINDRDIYYLGFRYGFSLFKQEVPKYLLLNGFWGNGYSDMAVQENYAHWVELITGFKVEVIKNWYLGMGLRAKFFLSRNKNAIEPVQFVPGYGKNYSQAIINFNYTVYYNIPLNYKKKKIAVYEK
ncbi:MAG: hypothetical protein B7C24_07380 [Bacteroidetes bacterium 4572_77]|nr:MAG: hypothetical protein B7C24_07380 [Bacteroidetes bacterium 4572_77]